MVPNFSQYLEEGMLSTYRAERDGQKLTAKELKIGFYNILSKLIEERIPFYFDCQCKDKMRVGFLMHDTINGEMFNGVILDEKNGLKDLDKIFDDIIVLKPGKLHVGRGIFADLTKANDLDTITVVVKAFKSFVKEKNIEGRVVTGNKYEAHISIEFLCDSNNANNIIDYVF